MTPIPDAGEGKVEELAKAIATGLGYEWSTLYSGKAEYIADRGSRHDINTPYTTDFIEAARAVLTALRTPDAGMVEAACAAYHGDMSWREQYPLPDMAADELRYFANALTAAIDHLIKEGAGE